MGTLLGWQMGPEGELVVNMGALLGVGAGEARSVHLCSLEFEFGFGSGFVFGLSLAGWRRHPVLPPDIVNQIRGKAIIVLKNALSFFQYSSFFLAYLSFPKSLCYLRQCNVKLVKI